MTQITDPPWHEYTRRKGAQAVVFTDQLERSPWGPAPGVLLSLLDFNDGARAAGARDAVCASPRLVPIVAEYVDRVLAAMGAAPLTDADIADARAEVLP